MNFNQIGSNAELYSATRSETSTVCMHMVLDYILLATYVSECIFNWFMLRWNAHVIYRIDRVQYIVC